MPQSLSIPASPSPGQAAPSKSLDALLDLESRLAEAHRALDTALTLSGHPVTAVQGLLLARLGGRSLSVGALVTQGAYVGSNVSYNVARLVAHGYLEQLRNPHDKRSRWVSLTDKGRDAAAIVRAAADGLPALAAPSRRAAA